ncbi:NHL repeat protein [Dictyocaulus viviparus]|uniref:NHL repeat protein n=1 Tax=Dictyocaulus viviparus TaxID=29172 RepID=A0A0D8XSG3_DICVI|nr:NHL repeat protein [Dictyocaulus viviparus]
MLLFASATTCKADSSFRIFEFRSKESGKTYNQYNELVEKTPIKEDVILVVAIKGNQTRIVKKLGKNMFYLPHGIYVDKKDYLYTTDVGSHTVAKWKINGDIWTRIRQILDMTVVDVSSAKRSAGSFVKPKTVNFNVAVLHHLELIWESGQKLQPGNDHEHFCKPSGVVEFGGDIFISDDLELIWESGQKLQPGNDHEHFCKPSGVVEFGGDIFISDGYCNSRIVQLDGVSGKRKNQFGMFGSGPTQFNLPHDVSISPNGHLLVADRENGRVQEFSIDGDFIMEWVSNLYTNIYSVDTYGSSIYMLPGRARDKSIQHEEGSTVLRKSLLMDSSRITPMATGTNGILISLVFAVVVVGSVVSSRKHGLLKKAKKSATFLSKKLSFPNHSEGFKPLRTDEVAGFISDGSDIPQFLIYQFGALLRIARFLFTIHR